MTKEGIVLANAAKASILARDETIRSSGISSETLVAAEDVLRTDAAAGFGQSRRDWRESEGRKQRDTFSKVAERISLPGRFIANEG